MIDDDVKNEFRKLDERLGRVEQILPTLATKVDLKAFATKEDLKAHPTRNETYAAIRDEGERTRRHFDVVAESLRDEIRLGLEGHIASTSRIDTLEHRHDRLEGRVSALEAPAPRRRK